jgi:predicted nucleotidyltransferase
VDQVTIQANAEAPVFAPLRELVLRTAGLADVLRGALGPIAPKIRAAFVYGSVAKGEDRATSEIDLMVISETLAYADLFAALEDASKRLGRTVNPTVYSPSELARRIRQRNAFVTKVLAQRKIWLVGADSEIPAR